MGACGSEQFEKLLAKEAAKRNISVPALLDAEVTSKVGLVTEQEIHKFWQDNKARLSYAREVGLMRRSSTDVSWGLPVRAGFFINGRPLTGAQPLAAFERMVEEESARKPDQRANAQR